MPEENANVKGIPEKILRWIDRHPRTGWYVSIIVTLNLIVSVVGLFH